MTPTVPGSVQSTRIQQEKSKTRAFGKKLAFMPRGGKCHMENGLWNGGGGGAGAGEQPSEHTHTAALGAVQWGRHF